MSKGRNRGDTIAPFVITKMIFTYLTYLADRLSCAVWRAMWKARLVQALALVRPSAKLALPAPRPKIRRIRYDNALQKAFLHGLFAAEASRLAPRGAFTERSRFGRRTRFSQRVVNRRRQRVRTGRVNRGIRIERRHLHA